jgi:putative PIN family toxin of toxin-antitoxin system
VRLVVDTNVLISGAFFPGPSSRILDACLHGRCQLVLSPPIFDEYVRVGEEFTKKRPNVDFARLLELLVGTSELVQARELPQPVCDDPDDDKFIECALAGGAKIITSGDKHLLSVSGYSGITVMRPRNFVDRYLTGV